MLLERQRRYDARRDTGEAEPVLASDLIDRFEHGVTNPEVDVELHEASTIEPGIDGKSRSTLGCLVKFQRCVADLEDEQVRQANQRGSHEVAAQLRLGRCRR